MLASGIVHQRDEASSRARAPRQGSGAARTAGTPAERARALQRAVGNRAFGRLLARDIVRTEKVREGKFKFDLKTQSNAGAKSGMKGSIEFHPGDTAPDSTSIRLFQAVRLEDLTTGKDYVWTGSESQRNSVQTATDPMRPGIDPGWFVDASYAGISPRTAKADPAISPYYRDYWPNVSSSQDGSKAGSNRKHASLWDYPGWSKNCRFSFETVAKGTDTGHVYGTVSWGFTISDGAKGTVTNEYGVGRNVMMQTTEEALRRFDEYFRNPGASTAPTT
jgi:hypothetical protein